MRAFLLLCLLTISPIFSQYSTNGLVAQYGFDNGSLLVDGANGQNFTQTGSSLTEINNRFGDASTSAVNLNGVHLTRSDIDFPVDALGYGNFETLSFWIKTTTNDSHARIIIDDSNRTSFASSNWAGNYVYLQDGKVGATLGVQYYQAVLGYRSGGVLTSKFISDGNWHHVAVLLSNSIGYGSTTMTIYNSMSVYIDGVHEGNGGNSQSSTGSISLAQSHDTNGNITVGNNRSNSLPANNRYFDVVDDILFYNRLLTAQEISDIANYSFCFAPNPSISIYGITETAAGLNVPGSAIHDIAYVKQSEPFSNAIIISNVDAAAAPFLITGLTPSTVYNVYNRSYCSSSTNASGWSSLQSFRTKGKIFVNLNATGSNNGSTWTDAFADLQLALNAQTDDQEIWIAAGTYHPSVNDRNFSFIVSSLNVKLYGGFSGTESQLSDRISGTNETILSGDLLNNDDTSISYPNTTRDDNSYIVVKVSNSGLLLDGLTITSGHANGGTSANQYGAGISKANTAATIKLKNTKVQKNVAIGAGAGMSASFTVSGARIDIENCVFSENVSIHGAGIYSYVDGANSAIFNVSNSLFERNKVINFGTNLGSGGSSFWIRAYGYNSTYNVNVIGNTFVKNEDLGTSTGMNNFNRSTLGIAQSGSTNRTMNVLVANNIFWGNTTTGSTIARSISGLFEVQPSTIITKNSIDQQNFGNIPAGSQTSTSTSDPLFVDFSNNVFNLTVTSPAINSGDNVSVIGTTDLLGNQRVFDTTVDMGAYEFGSTVLGTENFTSLSDFKMYPNPANSILNINSSEEISSVEIYSIEGKRVLISQNTQVDVSQLTSGIYLVKITTNANKVGTKKLVKQ